MDTNTTVNPVNLAGDTESVATLYEIYSSCERRIGENDEFPEGSAERKQFAVSVFGNNTNLFIKPAPGGYTAFHLAVNSDSTEMLEALIEAARWLPSSSSSTNDDPQTTSLETLLRHEYSESSDIVESIIEAGRRRYYSTDPTNHLFEDFIQQAESERMNTALHLAVMGNHLGVVKQILMANPSYICEDINRELKTPLYIAAEQGYKDIVRELCKHATLALTCIAGPRKQTVLHAAIFGRDKGCVEMALDIPLLTYHRDEDGWTALHHAAHFNFDSVIDILGQRFQGSGLYNSDLSSVLLCREGVPTPLWMAIEQGHTSTTVEIIKVLPSLCVDLDPKSRRNILHLAAEKNDKQTVQAILKTCPPEYLRKILNGRDINKNTPLHLLIAKGCFVKQLIEHEQIDKTARNYQNWTPFDMLYVQDHIVADQLAIKTLLDEANQNSSFWIWRRSSSNMDTKESFVPPKKRSEKDVKFKIAYETLMKAKVLRYRERTNTQIIVTALITTVTFTVGFTMPGGYYQSGELNQGSVLLANKTAFKAFIVSDAIALALSTTSLFLYFISSMYEDPRQVSKLNAVSTGLNIFSIVAMMLTFICGIYAVLSHSPALALAICLICSTFFVCIVVLLLKLGYDRKKLKDSLA
ncbi:hypothetical protein DCAR_0207082 [Daucus carota subsp. sativus]|uniref:PGG domain-containing protein n=1 Tax=Daucus carota subsp. sativus TaxID=79200 RepID=A0AAF0WGW4_DAUCS|nr:PREDICTED: protein ACCELERATED CELL DEATH 6-like [Daucus carota subsp. sativus]WOG87850.1 hypothetical protein DCAR_0207082 [Daucus carota subsp. sativus]